MPLHAEGHTIDLSNPLDMLYLNGDKTELEKALKLFRKNGGLKRYRLAQSDNVQKVLDEIASLDPGKISPILYESYSENLRKAVDQVFKRDSGTDLPDRLRANVSRFAAYKALNATREVQQKLGEDIDEAKRVIRTYNRYQATEYNTTVSRSRTAKQFEQFNTPDSLRLFPNLRWLPSRSVNPREQHTLFYNLVWAKNDDFWNENTPGSLWNCKCDWEETNDPVTNGNPQGNKSAKGLCGNPAETGEVFTTLATEMSKIGQKKGYIAHPYFSKFGIVESEREVSLLYHKDNKSDLMISAMADPSEIMDNLSTGRILSEFLNVKIAPHFTQLKGRSIKNPEFIIDGYIADAKRIMSAKGVGDAFKKALEQNCKIVILDLDKHNVRVNKKLSQKISARVDDFIHKGMLKCYIVKNGICIEIEQSLFQKYPNTFDKEERDNVIHEKIQKALD